MILRLLLCFVIIFGPLNTFSEMTTPPKSVEAAYFQDKNKLVNPGFELGKRGWTASSGTFAIETTNINNGLQSASWDASAAAQTLTSSNFSVVSSGGYVSANGVVSCSFKAASGTATHTLEAYDGSNVLGTATIVANTTTWTRNSVDFIFGTGSTTVALRIQAQANEPVLYIDDCYLGKAEGFNLGIVNRITDPVAYTPTFTGLGTVTNINFTSWRVGAYLFIQGYFTTGTTTATEAQITLGYAGVSANVTTQSTLPTLSNAGTVAGGTASATYFGNVTALAEASKTYLTVGANSASANGLTKQNGNAAFFNSVTYSMFAKVPIVGWLAESVYTPDQASWQVIADITGANPSLGISAVTAYTEIIDAGLTLTPVSGSAPVGIMCSTTNAATAPSTGATTCAAGSESIGANFNIPKAGWYEVCFQFTHNIQVDTGEGIFSTFNVIQTPLAAQTLTFEGGPRTQSGVTGMTIATGANEILQFANNACGQINFSAAGNVGVRLMYEQAITSTPDQSLIAADASANDGQRAIHLTVRPMQLQVPAPLLVNSVVSNNAGILRTITARLNCDSGSAITYQSGTTGDGIASIGNISAGACAVTIASGVFSTAPVCNVTNEVGASSDPQPIGFTTAPTTTALSVDCADNAGTDCTTFDFELICIGSK